MAEIPWSSIAGIIGAYLANQQNQGGGGAENSLIFPPTILPPDYPFQSAFWNQMAPQLMGMQIPSFEESGGIFGGPVSPMQGMANQMMQQQMTAQPMFMGGVAGQLGNLSGQTYNPGSADMALERFLSPNFINPELTDPWAMAQTPSPFSIGGGREGWGDMMGGGGGGGGMGQMGGGGGKGGKQGGAGGKGAMGGQGGGGFPAQNVFTPPGQGVNNPASASRSLGSSPAAAAAGPGLMMMLAKAGGGDDKPIPETIGPGPVLDLPPIPEIIGPDPTWQPPPGAGPGDAPAPPEVVDPNDPGVYGTSGPPGEIDVTPEQKGWWGRFWKWFQKNWTISGGTGLLDALEAYKGQDPFPGGGEPTVAGAGQNPPGEEKEPEEEEDDSRCGPDAFYLPGVGCIPTTGPSGGPGGGPSSGQTGEGGWWVLPDVEQPTLPPFQFNFQPSTFGRENFTPWTNPSTQMPIAQPGQVPSTSGWF